MFGSLTHRCMCVFPVSYCTAKLPFGSASTEEYLHHWSGMRASNIAVSSQCRREIDDGSAPNQDPSPNPSPAASAEILS